MKAWNDLENNKEITLWTTSRSRWYLDLGARIERFDDGEIVIKNIISTGENYIKATPIQMIYFEDHGWDAGRYKICVDEYLRKLDGVTKRILYAQTDEDIASANECYEEVRSKLAEFELKLQESLDNQ